MATILLIDKSSDRAQSLERELQPAGFNVIRRSDEDKALEQGEAGRADVIVLDMPAADGIHTLRELKSTPKVSSIPVILVAASDDEEVIVRALDSGAYDYECKPVLYPILNARIRAALRLSESQKLLAEANRNLSRLASQDPLTRAFNRRYFMERAEAELAQARRYHRSLSMIMLDVDKFKVVNDRFGHSMGDNALIELTMICGNNIRAGDFVGRLGGEEFAICCPDAALEGAQRIAERIRSAIHQHEIRYHQNRWHLTVSLGVTSLRDEDASLEDFMNRVDRLLYRAKEQGRNRVVSG